MSSYRPRVQRGSFRGRSDGAQRGRVRSRSPISRESKTGWSLPRNELDPTSIGIRTEKNAMTKTGGGFSNSSFASSGERGDTRQGFDNNNRSSFQRSDRGGGDRSWRGSATFGHGDYRSNNQRSNDDRDGPPRQGFNSANPAPRQYFSRAVREEQSRMNQIDEDPTKPMLNLLDPTKVPKGRSYFSHDDRERDAGMRGVSSRGFYRGSGRDSFNNSARDNNDRRAPIGWRNLDSGQRNDANDDRRRYSRDDWKPEMRNNRTNFNPRARIERPSEGAGIWRHDMFAVDHEDEKMVDESKEADNTD